MKKILTYSIVLLFLLMTVSSANEVYLENQTIVPVSLGNTLYVGGSGPGNYSKIQDAIDDASDGDTVFVYKGTYYENVVIDKSITLIGEDRIKTIIDGNKIGDVVYISANVVIISGFTIKNSGTLSPENYAGIKVDSVINTISDNIITNNFHNVYLNRNSKFNTVSYNIIQNNVGHGKGVDFVETNDNHILNNEFENNWWGMRLYSSHNNTISGNTILKSSELIYLHSSTNNLITENTFSEFNYDAVGLHRTANNNDIYHNNFLEGTHPDYLCSDDGNNTWDNGVVGNYWYDYNGTDNDGDGIGDTPYTIPGYGNNTDRYPLMEPWNDSNNAPYGPNIGLPDVNYAFCFDIPDKPYYEPYHVMWYWGDGYSSEWLGPYESGETVCANHKWNKPGDFSILVAIRDVTGYTFWSEPWTIIIVNITNLDINIQVKFPGKISAYIRNAGNVPAIDVKYSINVRVNGIFLGLRNMGQNGTFDILPPESEHIWTISKGLLIGFGRFQIIVTARAFNAQEISKEMNGFVLLFFIKIYPGG